MDISTERLTLHAVDEAEARRIHERAAAPEDSWAGDYPSDGDVAATGGFLHATEKHGEQRPFGYYQIVLRCDGLAVGGIGFKGVPQDGSVEIGYGLAPSARGHGYATEALRALLRTVAGLGVGTVRADTVPDNIPSQRTLENAGFAQTGADDELRYYAVDLHDAHVPIG